MREVAYLSLINTTIHWVPVNVLIEILNLQVLWEVLKQILHLKVGCSDFGPVRYRGS